MVIFDLRQAVLIGVTFLTIGEKNMAARRMAQESLDSVLQEKSKRYGDSEAVGEALHLNAQGELRCLACAGGALWTIMLWVQAELL